MYRQCYDAAKRFLVLLTIKVKKEKKRNTGLTFSFVEKLNRRKRKRYTFGENRPYPGTLVSSVTGTGQVQVDMIGRKPFEQRVRRGSPERLRVR
jgi:hypothetical protein